MYFGILWHPGSVGYHWYTLDVGMDGKSGREREVGEVTERRWLCEVVVLVVVRHGAAAWRGHGLLWHLCCCAVCCAAHDGRQVSSQAGSLTGPPPFSLLAVR